MNAILTTLWVLAVAAAGPSDLVTKASSDAGAKYAVTKAFDGNVATRWASQHHPEFPEWVEVRFPSEQTLDSVVLRIAVDNLYGDWKNVEVSFSSGDPVRKVLEPESRLVTIAFEPRKTEWVRVSVLSVHSERAYVGLLELIVGPKAQGPLGKEFAYSVPRAQDEVVVRGRSDHPCVNVTPADVEAAKKRIERHEWARKERDEILAEAERWMTEPDEYWLQFLPEPGACYAYGRTGCPICGATFGTWHGARCSWDTPWKATCANGHVLPNEDYPDDGTGYTAPDGRVHYIMGVWNAWVTERWTQYALPSLSQAYLLTGDERYAERGTMFLDALASVYKESTSGSWDYPSTPPSGRLCRPWYQVARTLVLYVDWYDFMYNSPSMDRPSLRPVKDGGNPLTRRENIEQNLLLDGAYYCYKHSFSGALHNGHADYMRGALAVGCVLDVPLYVDNSVQSPFSIHTMLANNIDRDGRYYETSLGYALHARNLYLTFADPLLNLRSKEYPQGINLYADPRFRSCMVLPELQVKMAGRLPNFGDCGPDTVYRPTPKQPFSPIDYRYLERLYARAATNEDRKQYGQALLWLADGELESLRESAHDRTWLMWHAGDLPEANPALPPALSARVEGSWVAGMKGMALLRAGEQDVLLRFGPSLNHGDPDDLGLLYYANGYELSYDIGYGFGSAHCHVGWASQTISHCIATVDETSQFKGDIGTSGGSLRAFADLPAMKLARASSERSYASLGVSKYERTVALMADGKYLVDIFEVEGGSKHDYGWGSLGTDLTPFGAGAIEELDGSLAPGYAWGEKILPEGDIEGYPDKPYWNPPPGNGYGFFYNVRRAAGPDKVWGGAWAIDGNVPTQFRMHYLGDPAEAVWADAPGLVPAKTKASYILARRKADPGEDTLSSTFLAIYEPFKTAQIAYDYDCHALLRAMVKADADTKVVTGLGVAFLRGQRVGDSMTFSLDIPENTSQDLRLFFVKAPSYGVVQVLWDGTPVGKPINLGHGSVAGPFGFDIGKVDTTPGEHILTLRMCEADVYFLGVAGLRFGGSAAPSCDPVIGSVRRLAPRAVEVQRTNGVTDVLLLGSAEVDCAFGGVVFEGEAALLRGGKDALDAVDASGCRVLTVNGERLADGPGVFDATLTAVDHMGCTVTVDGSVPGGVEGLVAVFSNPSYEMTAAYHVDAVRGNVLHLRASSLVVGRGRMVAAVDKHQFSCDVPHPFLGTRGTGFVNGKRLVGASGGETRVRETLPTSPLTYVVDDTGALKTGELFDCIDLSPGDTVRVALPLARRF